MFYDGYYDEDENESYYLIKFGSGIYIGHFVTPTLKTTIEELKKWNSMIIHNSIAINNIFPPQTFTYGDIEMIWKIPMDDFKKENQDFREILKALFDVEGAIGFWDYQIIIQEFCNKE